MGSSNDKRLPPPGERLTELRVDALNKSAEDEAIPAAESLATTVSAAWAAVDATRAAYRAAYSAARAADTAASAAAARVA